MKKLLILLILLLCPITAHAGRDMATVVKVVDSTTIEITRAIEAKHPANIYTVRIIGVVVPPEQEAAALEQNKKLLGKTVFLEYDNTRQDKEKNLLAYIWLENYDLDPRDMHNSELILLGCARFKTAFNNNKYSKNFDKLQTEAKKIKKGLWGDKK